jgi:hypothetical protein
MTKSEIPQMQLTEAESDKISKRAASERLHGRSVTILANQKNEEPSVALMLQGVLEAIQHGEITPQHVDVLGKMTDLYERHEKRQAEKDFAVAFNQLMAEMPEIQATKPVPNKDGTIRYRYAPLDEIEPKVRPVAIRNGFSYSFAEGKSEPGAISKVLTIQHKGGHSRSNIFTVRRSTPPNANDSQADGNTHSYAKRGAFCDGFGIVVEHDDDARVIGKPIGKAIAEDLLNRVKLTGSDMISFLKFAGVTLPPKAEIENYDPIEFFEQIPDERFEQLDEILKRKEAKL